MPQDPEVDVAAFLAAAGVGLSLGTNLFRGPVLAVGNGVPAEAVFVEQQPGEPPETFLGGDSDYYFGEVEVTVRGPQGDRATPRANAGAYLLLFQRAELAGYVRVVALESSPEYIEMDEAECHEYRFSVSLEWQRSA